MQDALKNLTRQTSLQGLTGVLLAFMVNLGGCLSPVAIHQAVLAYDHTVNRVEAEMLLLNIARARHHLPAHYTGVTSIAATFDFRSNVGIGGQLFGNPTAGADVANLFMLNLGASVAESPTVTIVPIQGEEFTKRILSQLDETKFWFLYRQELDPGLLLRLMAREVQIDVTGEMASRLYHNLPHHPDEYREFRRRLLHLSGLDLQHKLWVGPLRYQETWPLPPDHSLTKQALDQGYQWIRSGKDQPTILTRHVIGRIAVTNYDPAQLSNDERRGLDEEAQRYPRDHTLVDIHPGYPGGEFPWHGRIEFRSFDEILVFLGRSIKEEPEFAVDPDPRTAPVLYNPSRILEIFETAARPPDTVFAIELEGHWYSIKRPTDDEARRPSQNLDVFRILSQLYQMTVIDIARVPALPITIGK
jgi:hypothetical protein